MVERTCPSRASSTVSAAASAIGPYTLQGVGVNGLVVEAGSGTRERDVLHEPQGQPPAGVAPTRSGEPHGEKKRGDRESGARQCNSSPATAPANTMYGSRTLKRSRIASASAAITPVGTSTTAWRVSTTVAPAMAPAAAAVAPLTNALTWRLSRWRMN